ncbi:MAG: aspartyl protease family protein [Acidobacteriota bacterium]
MRWIHNTGAPLAAFATVGILVCLEAAKADGLGWAALFNNTRLDPALREIRSALSSAPNDSRVLARLGDVLFLRANFDGAEEAYQTALRANQNEARGYWGLGRLASLNSRPVEAKRRFEEAFAHNPRDPEILLSYAEYAPAGDMRTDLWKKFLDNSPPSDIQRREDVAARLILATRLGGRLPMQIAAGARQPHRIPIINLGMPSGPRGLILKARINGSKPIRLLLDSGAEGIYVKERTARKLNLELLAETRVGGLGSSAHANGKLGLASRLAIEDLEFENSPVRVLDLEWLSEADGVMGTDVFKDFLIRVDSRRRVLELQPYSETPMPSASKMYRIGHQLFAARLGERTR